MMRVRVGWRPGRSLEKAFREMEKAARQDMRVMKKELVKASKQAKKEVVDLVVEKTGLSRPQSKRRVREFKSRKAKNAFAGINLTSTASIVHAGRLKASSTGRVRGAGGRFQRGGLKFKGIPGGDKAFYMNPERWRGQLARVYQREDGKLESVNHPYEIEMAFGVVSRIHAHRLLNEALDKARAQNRAKYRAKFGQQTGQLGRLT